MALSLKPKHLARYGAVARLLVKHGHGDLVRRAGLAETLAGPPEEGLDEGSPAAAEELRADLEALGPTYIKLGQLLSTRADLLPVAYLEALEGLQDEVEPFPGAQAIALVEEELGVRVAKAFRSFEEEPLGAASLGQVHRAVLRDGRAVAVKVQRPDIRQRIADDLEALGELAKFVDDHTEAGRRVGFGEVLAEFRVSLGRELDYRQEASNLMLLAENLAGFDRLVIPRPVLDYTTDRVLTMDYVRGRKITRVSPLARLEVDGAELGEQLFQAYLKQVLVDGVFHADPHPGNVFLTEDGRLALLDLGMVGYVSQSTREGLLKLLLAVAEGRAEEAARASLDLGRRLEGHDEERYLRETARLVMQHGGATLDDTPAGRIFLELTRVSSENLVRQPPELALFGKTLLNLDQVTRTLDPEFRPAEALRRNAAEVLRRRMLQQASPSNVAAAIMELSAFARNLPERMNRVLDRVADNDLELRVRAFDEVRFLHGMEKIANRITLGVVLAALIMGAAMLMRVDTAWTILGYPALAMLLFLAAAVGGLVLAVSIVLGDRDTRRH
jgi:predicted unusual protein kinase regulating ubiquinone biosynthesis (AarF/ABC1/UbiB family)